MRMIAAVFAAIVSTHAVVIRISRCIDKISKATAASTRGTADISYRPYRYKLMVGPPTTASSSKSLEVHFHD